MSSNIPYANASSPMNSANPSSIAANSLPPNPFVGLRPFTSDEGLLFFGRRDQTFELLDQLHRTRFLAVVGSSGCGKSSLIRAGLIPKLKAGFLVEEYDQWRIAIAKPGDAPIQNLAQALLETFGGHEQPQQLPALIEAMRCSCAQAVVDYLKPLLENSSTNLLLLIDQFEELFNFAGYKETQTWAAAEGSKEKQLADAIEHEGRREEASDFVSIMLGLAKQTDLPIYVVMTMRSDFLGDCDAFFGLPEAMNKSQYLVPRLTRQQRHEAIESPIVLYGQEITSRALDAVLNDAGEEGDQLPVMQHAMMRTWEKWRTAGNASVDLPDYEAAGTTKRALSEDAEEAMQGLTQEDLLVTERLFQSLTDTDARGRQIRRPAHLSEIEAITEASREKLLEIINRFRSGGRSFLYVTQDKNDPLVDISHESLIRQWERLREWVAKEALWKELYLRLVGHAIRFSKNEDELLSGPALQAALAWVESRKPNQAWANRYQPDLEMALNFLRDSKDKRDKDAAERERLRNEEIAREKRDLEQAQLIAEQKQRVAEAEAAKQRTELQQAQLLAQQKEQAARWQRQAIYALAVLSILAIAGGASAFVYARRASANERRAIVNESAALIAKNDAVEAQRKLEIAQAGLAEKVRESLDLNAQLQTNLKEQERLKNEAIRLKNAAIASSIDARKKEALAKGALIREKRARESEKLATAAKEEALEQARTNEFLATSAKAKAEAMQSANNTFREALFLSKTNDTENAAAKFKEAADEYLTINDLDATATAYFELGDTYLHSSLSTKNSKKLQQGFDYLEQAGEVYEEVKNNHGHAAVLMRMGDLFMADDLFKEASIKDATEAREFAVEFYKSAYENYEKEKDQAGMKFVAARIGAGHLKIGRAYLELDEAEEATKNFDAAIETFKSISDAQGEVRTYVDIGFAKGSKDLDTFNQKALEKARTAGGPDSPLEAETYRHIAEKAKESLVTAERDSEDYRRFISIAADSLGAALQIYERRQDRIKQAELQRELGVFKQAAGLSGALEHLQKAQSLYSADEEDAERAGIILDIGSIYEERGEIQEAKRLYEEALEIFRHRDEGWGEMRAERALERLEEVKRPRRRARY